MPMNLSDFPPIYPRLVFDFDWDGENSSGEDKNCQIEVQL